MLEAKEYIPDYSPGRNIQRGITEQEYSDALEWYSSSVSRARISGRFAEYITLTPAIAMVLLERNPSNRKLSGDATRYLASALRAGEWEENGEAIIIADTGELNDGQHRCAAVLSAEVNAPVLITFGVRRESRKTVDTGAKRQAGHGLAMYGVTNATKTAAALKFFLNLESGMHINTHRTTKTIERALADHPGILDNAACAQRAAAQFHQSTGMFIALHYMMRTVHGSDKASDFFSSLADGTAPEKNHPVARLRQRLTENLAAKAKLPTTEVAALTIKAWNQYVTGGEIRQLRWRTEGDKAELFPKVR